MKDLKIAFVLVVLILFCIPRCVDAQNSETFCAKLLKNAEKLDEQGAWDAAEQQYQRAITYGAKLPESSLQVADAERQLADIEIWNGKAAYATELASDALDRYRKIEPPHPERIATTLSILAAAREQVKHFDETVPALYKESIATIEKNFGTDAIQLAPILADYALYESGRYEKGEDPKALILRAMNIVEKTENKGVHTQARQPTMDIAAVVSAYAQMLRFEGGKPHCYASAAFSRQALSIASGLLPANHPRLQRYWYDYAESCYMLRDYAEAQKAEIRSRPVEKKKHSESTGVSYDLRHRLAEAMQRDSKVVQEDKGAHKQRP